MCGGDLFELHEFADGVHQHLIDFLGELRHRVWWGDPHQVSHFLGNACPQKAVEGLKDGKRSAGLGGDAEGLLHDRLETFSLLRESSV